MTLAEFAIPDPLPLRTIVPPAEVTRVNGCDCGGLEWHRDTCSIWAVPHADALAAVDDAHAREQAFTDGLNRKLREAGL